MRLNGITVLTSIFLLINSFFHPIQNTEDPDTGTSTEITETAQEKERQETEVIDPVENSDSFSAVVYNNRNGLPTSEANDIVETEDGFIWIGCYSGLIRYDGNTFERIDSTTGIGNVVSLLVDQKDRLWIGTNDSGLFMMDRTGLHKWGEADGLRSLKISTMQEDRNGTIYVSTAAGIYMFDEDLNLIPIEDSRLSTMYVDGLSVSADGETLYGISNEGDVFSIRNGEIVNFFRDIDYPVTGVIYIMADPEEPDKIYLGTNESVLYHCRFKGSMTVEEIIDIDPLFGVMAMKILGGRIWISGRNGIGVLAKGTFHDLSDLPLNNSVGSIMSDYEGNLWFTSTRQGVMKIVPNQFNDLFERYGLTEQVVNTTCMLDGNLFIGTDTGLIVTNDDGPLSKFPLKTAVTASGEKLETDDLLEMLEDTRIRSIIRDSQNRLWIATWQAYGILCYDRGNLTAYQQEDGLFSDHIRVSHEAQDGSILIANTGGVSVLKDGKIVRSYGAAEGIENPETLTVSSAPNGDIVLGSDGGGIYVIRDGKATNINTRDGLTSGIILRIKYDKNRHLFWIITSNSIAWMTEDYEITTVQKFPYSNNYDLYEDANEEMWVLSSNGIYILPTDDLLSDGDLNPIHFGIDNGMPCISTVNSYSELTEDGDLYIAGNSGVAKVNTNNPVENVIDLKITVPYVDIDGERIYQQEAGRFYIPSSVHKLTVYPYVFNYSLTNPTVLYKLEGFDTDYTRVKRSDLDPVAFTNLPGGKYRFVIWLKDSQELTGKTVSVVIVKEKKVYEETWFYVLSVIGALALIVAGIWLYIRRKTRVLEEKNREEVQKARLNTELKTAGQIQESVLPHTFPPFPDLPEFDIYASMTPAREVGGDFYDFFQIDDDHLCLIMADVSGKGIPAAMFMMNSMAILQSYARLGLKPAEILTKTNEVLCAGNRVEMFVTVWVGILDIRTGSVSAANAGHEYPALMQKGEFTLLKDPHGFVIGGMEGMKYKEYEFVLEPGDAVFLYTDGVPEATNAGNEMYGTDRMLETLNEHRNETPQEILQEVHLSINRFVKEAEQFDDLTMMCLRFNKKRGA